MKKTISGGARQAKRSLDSAVSSLLALFSREYAQLVQRTTGLYTEGAPERMYMYMYMYSHGDSAPIAGEECLSCLMFCLKQKIFG